MNKTIGTLFSLSVMSLVLQTPAKAITLEFTPTDRTTSLGNQVSVDLAISDLGDGIPPSLGAFGIDLAFDSSILAFNDVMFGNQLDLFGLGSFAQVTSLSSSDLSLIEISFDSTDNLNSLQLADFVLATITFDAIGIGTTDLTFNDVELLDAFLPPNSLSADLNSGSITVERGTAIVPESSTVPGLLALGTIGILTLRPHQKLTN